MSHPLQAKKTITPYFLFSVGSNHSVMELQSCCKSNLKEFDEYFMTEICTMNVFVFDKLLCCGSVPAMSVVGVPP